MPLVSVLLPTYNRNASNYLRNAIMSVLEQDMQDFELFVVDDGSQDGSNTTIAEFVRQDPRVHHIRFEKNIGLPALTCFAAFQKSVSEFIAWQFDDCVWERDLLSSLLQVANANPSTGMVYGQAKLDLGDSTQILGEEFDLQTLLKRNIIPNCSTLTRRVVFSEVGWLDPSIVLKRICDYDMWLRISEKYDVAFLEKVVAVENGMKLPDSLGNSVTFIPSLSERYRNQDRTSYLQISNAANWNPFRANEWMDDDDRQQLAQLIIEHFLRVNDCERAIAEALVVLPKGLIQSSLDLSAFSFNVLSGLFVWYIDKLSEGSSCRETDLRSKIRKQANFIEEQRAYIDRQHEKILELSSALSQSPSSGVSLKADKPGES
ncbi:glycosyltransferase family A protein [Pseudomonas viridiflava]|uniref:glycosyltransferase family 2 protein n=1 Tax=Pseudomonas atacamensis TaxID=2565368 RepID=UPI000F04828B